MMVDRYEIIDRIYSSSKTLVYKAIDEHKQLVTLKTVTNANDQVAVGKLYRELAISQRLGDGYAYATLIEADKPYLVKPYLSGQTLATQLSSQGMPLTTFMTYASALTREIIFLHSHHILHLDLNPMNILCTQEDHPIHLLDFGESITFSDHHNAAPIKNIQVTGGIAYSAPEQTGLSNQSIDVRSDLYALGGVIFYEMLTGKHPFYKEDNLQLAHAHLAETAVPIQAYRTDIPEIISKIVHKLLSKDKHFRYQSAHSLLYDLNRSAELNFQSFPLGSQDQQTHLYFQPKLYGREQPLEHIRSLLQAHQTTNQPLILLISGYSGVGKSFFVHEIKQQLIQQGLFIKGKFDQYNRTTAYIALTQAFKQMIDLLVETPDTTQPIQQLLNQLGDSKYVLAKLIPELAQFLAIQHLPVIEPTQLKNQLITATERLLNFMSQYHRKLVLFFDDLQWIDSASLEILEKILTSKQLANLIFIGAYRSNEIDAAHPMQLAFTRLKDNHATLYHQPLQPLDLDAIVAFLQDVLKRTDVLPLAELLVQKTEGNPFFLKQFVSTLEKSGLLWFNQQQLQWQWDIARIQRENMTSNVVEHLIKKINHLTLPAQTWIKTAAVIGDQFSTQLIAQIAQLDTITQYQLLDSLTQEGLIIVPNEQNHHQYHHDTTAHFVHDKIRQAAYALLNAEEKQHIHLMIVQQLIQKKQHNNKDILFLASHLIEIDISTQLDEYYRTKAIDWLQQAAQLTQEMLAYEESSTYSQAAISLLEPDAWQQRYAQTAALHYQYLDTTSKYQAFAAVEERFEHTIAQPALTALDKAKLTNLKVNFYFSHGMLINAIEEGLIALAYLNIVIPNDTSALNQIKQQQIELINAHTHHIAALETLPNTTDPAIELAMSILVNIGIPAFVSRQDLFAVIAFKLVQLSIDHGNSRVSAYGYMLCGMIFGASLNRFKEGYQFGQLALKLQEKFNNKAIECKLLRVYGAYVNSWVNPHRDNLDILYKAYHSGIETGDFSYAAYSVNHIFTREFLLPIAMDELEHNAQTYRAFIERTNEQSILKIQELLIHIPKCLRGNTQAANSLSSNTFDEIQAVDHFKRIQFNTLLIYYYIYKAQVCYLHEYYDEAISLSTTAETYLGYIKGNILETEWVFYYALSLSAAYLTGQHTQPNINQLTILAEKFAQWSTLNASNFLAQHLVIQGILHYFQNNISQSLALLDNAVNFLDEQSPTLRKGVILELIGLIWLHQNNRRIAKVYLQEAYTIFYTLKATLKAKLIYNTHYQLFGYEKNATFPSSTPTTAGELNIFDETTILKATELIAGKTTQQELINKFMRIISVSFGVQLGCLILKEGNEFYLEGIFDIDNKQKITITHQRLENDTHLPKSIIHYVIAQPQPIIIDDAFQDERFASDPAVIEYNIASAICAPILLKDELIGIVYLQNNHIKGFFDHTRQKVLDILLTQTAATLELERLYSHDKLTGLLSRLKLDEVIELGNFSTILLVNIADLDTINSTYGYITGDEVIKAFVHFLTEYSDADNQLYRLSGDEFVMVSNNKNLTDMTQTATDILTALAKKKFTIFDFTLSLSCAIGITDRGQPQEPLNALVRAHAAMKEVRKTGTNKCMIYSPDSVFIKKQQETLAWIHRVKEAIDEDRIIPYYQPIIDNVTLQVHKYECLARMVENEQLISPFFFLEPARLAGLMPTITQIMLNKVFAHFSNLPYSFSINITEEDLKENDLIDRLQSLSQRYGIHPKRVTIEVLENISADQNSAASEQLSALKRLGYSIALDDFGSEKSNFMRLQSMDVDYLKIDGSYIKDIHKNPNNYKICQTIVHLARALDSKVIAEFVHSKEVFNVVKSLGIDYSQGYYFSEPKADTEPS